MRTIDGNGRSVIMRRHTFALEVRTGMTADFRRNLGSVWPELTEFLDEHRIKNFSIWNVESIVFGYYETDDGFEFSQSDREQVTEWEMRYGNSYT